MADRYWVLGSGFWSSTNTTNWSASSGGTGGASVPTAADNVFFDANSNVGVGSFTCTMSNTPRVCNNFTASGLDGVMTLAGTNIGLTVSGSLTFQATNFTRTYTGTTTFDATTTGKTITTNGVSLTNVTFNGVGGEWTLGSALNCGFSTLTITNGVFNTSSSGNYAVTADSISSSNSNARTISLNASTVELSGSNPITFTTSTNLTFNAGTSQINCSSFFGTLAGGNKTFYNVSFTNTGINGASITEANTFNNLTITGRTSVGNGGFSFNNNQTINGTFTVSAGTASAFRVFIRSDTIGTTRTLTCASIAAMTDVDFRDITIAGAHGALSGTRLGDCKGNTNITFPAAKTVYYRQTGSANWGATGSGSWSATSGGALDATKFPLAQDTAVFPAATYPASGSTTTINSAYNIGTIDMSLRTSNTMTLSILSFNTAFYGNFINGSGTTLSSSTTIIFSGRTIQQITSASKSFSFPVTIQSPTGTFQLQDNFANTGGGGTTTLTSGTLKLQTFTLSTVTFSSSNTNTRTIALDTGTITCTGSGTTWNTSTATNLTTTGTGTINLTSASAKTLNGGNATFNCTLNQGGAGALTITGSNTFSNITNTYKSTGATSILFTAGTTSTFTSWNANGESTRLLTIGSVTAANHTLFKESAGGTISSDFLSISRSTATGGAGWYAGVNSTDGGNNLGWIFTVPPPPSPDNSKFLVFF